MLRCSRFALGGLLFFTACDVGAGSSLRLGVTTTTRDSGLLEVLLPAFEAESGTRVDAVATPTRKALALAAAGDVDVVWVHHRRLELEFLRSGQASRHEPVMESMFQILGPSSDPADIRGLAPEAALRRIEERGARFVSRGDESGTHIRELELWEASGERPSWSGYVESASGMGPSLMMADQMGAYLLSDRGTYLRYRAKTQLEPLVRDAESGSLRNPYGVLVVSPDVGPWVRHAEAQQFVDWLVGPRGRALIEGFRVDGEAPFRVRPSDVEPGPR